MIRIRTRPDDIADFHSKPDIAMMARLNEVKKMEPECPIVTTSPQELAQDDDLQLSSNGSQTQSCETPASPTKGNDRVDNQSCFSVVEDGSCGPSTGKDQGNGAARKPLRTVENNAPPLAKHSVLDDSIHWLTKPSESSSCQKRRSPARSVKRRINYREPRLPEISDAESFDDLLDSESLGSLADFIIEDEDEASMNEDSEDFPRLPFRPLSRIVSWGESRRSQVQECPSGVESSHLAGPFDQVELSAPEKPRPRHRQRRLKASICLKDATDSKTLGGFFNGEVFDGIEPPPSIQGKGSRLSTPPSTPSRRAAKLGSPANSIFRIPPSLHRPSIDAFWSSEVINTWNEQYSPQKTLTVGPRRPHSILQDSDEDCLPSISPRKYSRSPCKEKGEHLASKAKLKTFNQKKHSLAQDFLVELDDKVANGAVGRLAASTGGVKIIWSKKLNSTAGRANWKRETLRRKESSSPINPDLENKTAGTTTTYRHFASIELAEKVIDDEG